MFSKICKHADALKRAFILVEFFQNFVIPLQQTLNVQDSILLYLQLHGLSTMKYSSEQGKERDKYKQGRTGARIVQS